MYVDRSRYVLFDYGVEFKGMYGCTCVRNWVSGRKGRCVYRMCEQCVGAYACMHVWKHV